MKIADVKNRTNDTESKKKFKDYHFNQFANFLEYAEPQNKDVAVLGCSTGLDCQLFMLAGAKRVFGIDLDPKIGSDFQFRNVTYFKSSISKIEELEDNSLDIAYSVAVFEHVFDIPGALNECTRLLKPGGTAYILSSPLWNSPFGHHFSKELMPYPWIHLVMEKNEFSAFLAGKGIKDFNGKSIHSYLNYIYHPQNFNRFPATYYEFAAKNLEGVKLVVNKTTQLCVNNFANQEYFIKCLDRGYTQEELLSSQHLLVFRKL